MRKEPWDISEDIRDKHRINKNIPGLGPQKKYSSRVTSAAEKACLSRMTPNWRMRKWNTELAYCHTWPFCTSIYNGGGGKGCKLPLTESLKMVMTLMSYISYTSGRIFPPPPPEAKPQICYCLYGWEGVTATLLTKVTRSSPPPPQLKWLELNGAPVIWPNIGIQCYSHVQFRCLYYKMPCIPKFYTYFQNKPTPQQYTDIFIFYTCTSSN